ncbi:Bacterial protein of unknown function (DUF937) [Cylindrospermum stagnale PCC 7417]|uniref:DUF937 domain-containing protein n=1 Tax=Cylindrospermum stagnale PCC 7417 TaxID=56107 RepID=K9WVR0_9NOST|nr:DUF937 domain-containing protein [Cylindrospermum stagnale]AFZ24470.1 Bacterial protein of unknown function (DUF937) [Cylindrospermum stagnale PCC 7417]
MGLFDQILGAVSSSNQQGGLGQIGNLLNTVEQLKNTTGADSATIQTILTVVGGQVRSSLQDKQATDGDGAAQNFVNQFAGTSPDTQAVNSLFSPAIQQQVAEIAAQRTGLDAEMIQQLLPSIVPVVLNFLQAGGNPAISSFLDGDGDGDVDIADAIKLASRFLGR